MLLGEILQPNFSRSGKLLGFNIRTELAPLFFIQSDFQFEPLRRVVKSCIYMNRLVKYGVDQEFELKEVVDEPKQKEKAKIVFTNHAVQCDLT
jgi:hypothetical protein